MAWDKGKKGEQDAAEKGAAPSETEKGATAEKGGRDGAAQAASRAAGAAAGAARGAGRGIAAGFTALRDVRDASREHSSAKTQMEAMEKDLAAKRAALEHRESIEAGYDGIVEAMQNTQMDYFVPQNTPLRVENGKVVEIIRAYVP